VIIAGGAVFRKGDRTVSESIDRRRFLGLSVVSGFAAGIAGPTVEAASNLPVVQRARRAPAPFLTEPADFVDVSRGNPKPFTLRGESLARARLTPETWRLEVVSDGSAQLERPARLEDGTALDLATLRQLGQACGVKYLKAMQCNNIPFPLGQGLWEGVPLREVLRRAGRVADVRRVYYWGFHNDDPAQLFQSSLAYNRAMETPPWEPPPLVAYRLNGRDIPLERGGPVRMVVPWAHGFKSIKWLQRIVLTNDYKANDTYALQNNDPESHLKTAAYLRKDTLSFHVGEMVDIEGTAMVGWSGLERVEYWLRPGTGANGKLADDDPAWKTAVWRPCDLMPPPEDWTSLLPPGTTVGEIWGFDRRTGKPRGWPLPYSMVPFSVRLEGLAPGSYEFRARAVDRNGFAQPEPRPYPKSGQNSIPCQTIEVKA
jgi:DMSO/TMAO reductase YedYZ molybdopterin-dependent catalytic subunit